MEIGIQSGENIYNVAGGMHLHNSPEVIAILNSEKQKKLKELNSISYFEILLKEYSEKNLIERGLEVKKITDLLNKSQQLILYGEPGLGKTTTLFQLSKRKERVVYISIKGKSPISVISYLINKIRLSNDDELLEIKSIDEAFDWFQASLQRSKQYFIIDDCEQDTDTVSKIIALQKFESTFLYSTRNKSFFQSTGVEFYECSPFSADEIKLYLETHKLSLSLLETNELIKISNGNPLYLFYFSQFEVSPLPKDLIGYQNSIWSGLSIKQQEILAIISIPYFNITTEDIATFLKYDSTIGLSNDVDELSALIKNYNGILELFHPSFKEFVLEILKSKGLLSSYQEKLGDFYLAQNEIVQATYLLIDIAPNKVDKYLFDVFPSLIGWGELSFALKVLNTKLQTSDKEIDKGYLYYHLCYVHHLLGNKDESTICIDKSLIHLKNAKNRKFYAAALMFKAMNLIDHGKVEEATRIADKVFAKIKDDDKKFKAPLLVNLSKIYVDISEFEKGANACKEAFEIFEKLGSTEGMMNSLVNLVTCLSQIDDHINEAEAYGLKVLDLLKGSSDYSIEVIVSNALASIYREKKEYPKAKEYSVRAIELCQKLEMKDKAILNLINFGNILRDEGGIDEAKKIYNEALIKAKEYNLKRDEGRIYWILSSIYRETGNLDSSIEYATKSIECSKKINFSYGAANALREKSDTYLLMGEALKAADALVESAEFFGKIDQFTKSYQNNISKAIQIYGKAGEKDKVNALINDLLANTAKKIDVGEVLNLILDNSNEITVTANFKKLFESFFTNNKDNLNILRQFLSFIDYCNGLEELQGKKLFMETVDLIIDNIGKSKFSFSILGIAIEQSGNLLDQNELNAISILLHDKLEMFATRQIGDEQVIITSIKGRINLEIHVFSDEATCFKLALSLILILHELPDLVIDEKSFSEKSCILWLHLYSDQIQNAIGDLIPDNQALFQESIQTVHMDKNGYDIHEMILVNPNYEINSNLTLNPDNKASLYFLVTTIMGIKSHFYHSKVPEDNSQRRFILNAVARLFDYTNTELSNKPIKSKFEIDIDKITT